MLTGAGKDKWTASKTLCGNVVFMNDYDENIRGHTNEIEIFYSKCNCVISHTFSIAQFARGFDFTVKLDVEDAFQVKRLSRTS